MSELVSLSGLKQAIRKDKCKVFDGKIYIPEDELDLAIKKSVVFDKTDDEWLDKLKSCPGCFSEARIVREVFDDGDVWFRPECSCCKIGFQENYPTVKEAVEAWNSCHMHSF